MKEKGTCCVCKKSRVIFYNDMCQTCYKQSRQKEYKPKISKEIKNEIHSNIVKMYIEMNIPREKIANCFDMTKRNVDIIIKRYCEKK